MGYVIGQDNVSGGSMTATEIKEALETLTGDDRLDANYVKDIPSGSANIELITEQTVTGSAVADVTFSSLDLSDYYRVELIGTKVKTTAGTNQNLLLRVNGITSAHYSRQGQVNQTSSIVGIAWTIDEGISHIVVNFLYPSATNERKKWVSSAKNFTSTLVDYSNAAILEGGLSQATREAAITSITLFSASGNLDVGTNFKLIGYKY